ncbi:MAG TPA: hypothetical protein PLY88_04030 [Candidatus Omnitrophota bacterium]|nr:hypothetical protein [Candidatus Omnitrophota bacterium]
MIDERLNLKAESYYVDRYDLGTIQECLSRIKAFETIPLEKIRLSNEKLSDEEKTKCVAQVLELNLYAIKGERYCNKTQTVRAWMDKDRKRDEVYQSVTAPSEMQCDECSGNMRVILKQLYEKSESSLRVLFMLECGRCKKRKGVFDNGEKFAATPEHCPRCSQIIKCDCTEDGRNLIWSKKCSACGFEETEIDDFEKSKADRVNRELEEARLLKEYRSRFCFSAEEGSEYVISKSNFEQLGEMLKKAELRQNDLDYKRAENLDRWNVAELESRLLDVLGKEKYSKLIFDKPEMDRFVIVPFCVQDGDTKRNERSSIQKLRKLIQKTLEGSNWRLMSDGIFYRLGVLSGRLKGYEREEDMVGLVKDESAKRGAGQ